MVTILIMVVSETVVSHWVQMCLVYFLLRNADMRSAYLLQRCGWLAGCPSHAGIVSKLQNYSGNGAR